MPEEIQRPERGLEPEISGIAVASLALAILGCTSCLVLFYMIVLPIEYSEYYFIEKPFPLVIGVETLIPAVLGLSSLLAIIVGIISFVGIRKDPAFKGQAFAKWAIFVGAGAIVFIVAATWISYVFAGTTEVNEAIAIKSLRTLVVAQELFKNSCVVDQDSDGLGEYGYFQELAGSEKARPRTNPQIPGDVPANIYPGQFVSKVFGTVSPNGVATKSGYHFKIFLPSVSGTAAGETTPLAAGNKEDADAQEKAWICYAWPAFYGKTGNRCFVVNQQGEVLKAQNADTYGNKIYDGLEKMPEAYSAFLRGQGGVKNLSAPFPDSAAGEAGADGQDWVYVPLDEGVKVKGASMLKMIKNLEASYYAPIPSLLGTQMGRNEAVCVGMLRKIAASQKKFKAARIVDQDSDGMGEYGYFQELAGALRPRVDPRAHGPLPTPVTTGEYISTVFGHTNDSTCAKSGYHFFMYLPDGAGGVRGEDNIASDNTAADAQEKRFCCYAWPVTYDASGKRCFVINQDGDVYAAKNNTAGGEHLYSGTAGKAYGPPPQGAAFSDTDESAALEIAGAFPDIFAGELGIDGQLWVCIPPNKGEEVVFDISDFMEALYDAAIFDILTERVDVLKPSGTRRDMYLNEYACIETLEALAISQSHFKNARVVDQDGDASGEYGYLQELAGAAPPRTAKGQMPPFMKRGEYIPVELGKTNADGIVTKDGYHFRMFLPSASGGPAGESATLPDGNTEDADLQEQAFICYAWPVFFGKTGKRCFAVNHHGEAFCARNTIDKDKPLYYGLGRAPQATAAFVKGHKDADKLTAPLMNWEGDRQSNDGQAWFPAMQ